MRLTKEHIERLITPKGGYTKEVLRIMGVHWPPPAGWKIALVGREIDEQVYRLALKKAGGEQARLFEVKNAESITAPEDGSYRCLIVPLAWKEEQVSALAASTLADPVERCIFRGKVGDEFALWHVWHGAGLLHRQLDSELAAIVA